MTCHEPNGIWKSNVENDKNMAAEEILDHIFSRLQVYYTPLIFTVGVTE